MRPVLTAASSTALDLASPTALGVLMERAGLAVALAATEMGVGYGSRVVVLAGSGNNGGDGYVAAHYLAARGVDITVYAFSPPVGDSSRAAADRARRTGAKVRPWPAGPMECDLVIDALFGVGFHGQLHTRIVPWTQIGSPVLAVDIASGLDATTGDADGPAVRASRTVALHAAKVGHLVGAGPELTGRLTVADIGLTGGEAHFWWAEEADTSRPRRRRDAHKWSVGSVMIIGGSAGMTGAGYLAAEAALQFGAGAVAVAVNDGNRSDYGLYPGLLRPVLGASDTWAGGDVGPVLDAAAAFDVLVVGPGLESCDEFIAQILERRGGPVILDAGGLKIPNVIEALAQRAGDTLVTPHAGEFSVMTNQPGTYESASRLAKETGTTVLLKGSPTFVAASPHDGSRIVAITTPGPELATIGTGDVLAGMCAATWASGMSAPDAAMSAAYWHGIAGKDLSKETSVTALGLLGEIGRLAR